MSPSYALEATYFRTALLLGLIRGNRVHRWAEEAIAREADPPAAMIDVVSVAPTDLSELRHALWPLVIDPPPSVVLKAMYGLLHIDLVSGRRSIADTITVLRQMRSMLKLPPDMYAELNETLVAHAADKTRDDILKTWLAQFSGASVS